MPRGTFQAEHGVLGALNLGVNSEYVNFIKSPFHVIGATPATFQRIEALEGQRLDLYPYLAFPIETAGYFIRPELGVRYTSYDLRNIDGYQRTNPGAPQFTNSTPTRTAPQRPAATCRRSCTRRVSDRSNRCRWSRCPPSSIRR